MARLFVTKSKPNLLKFHITILVLKSISFSVLLRSDFHLYFVSVLQIISVFLSVSLNDIMLITVSILVSVNEYIVANE